ncbi:IPT/TIG domain-containing protein [Microbacterium sp. NPDC058389]|uniref:IPT/TIG domain-containing protein n=1 Tax=Microbacterium sp. NPDC058389 TaxID=3346475 RepID=UPI003667DE82
MTTPTLPAGTTLGKSFEYGLDLNLSTFAAPSWQFIRRMSGWAPTFPKVTSDVATYDDGGAPNEDVTGRGFAAAFTVQANRSLTSGLYLPEVEKILLAARAKNELAVLDVRFYHKPAIGVPNPNDAGRAFVTVEVSRQNTGNAEIEVLAVSLAGKGEFTPIANPYTGTVIAAPVVGSITPPVPTDGELLTFTGSGFLTATAVTIDGDPADFVPVNDATMIVQLPVGDAGDVPVIVTNPIGASAAYNLTRGA